MFCQKCGAQKTDDVGACPSCGAVVAIPSPATLAADKVTAASKDAFQAFKLFVSDPVGGLAGAFESLGHERALGVGIAFGAAFALCNLFATYMVMPVWGRPEGFAGFLKILVVSIVPVVSLFGATAAGRKACQGIGSIGQDAFVAGASLLPLGFVMLLASILGMGNAEVIAIFAIYAVCLLVLMLFTGLTKICKISERAATIALPLMLIATAWLTKVCFMAVL